jgi:undecaprenyl diphosphate synthase
MPRTAAERSIFMADTNIAGETSGLPRHIAIILDGNGRWAQKRGLPRTAGHAAGAETFRRIATYCKNIGVQYLTVYAFSTENWKRPPEEVKTIMGLLDKYLKEAIATMQRDKIKMKVLGDITALSPALQAEIEKTNEISQRYEGFQANICLNYGGRDEIVHAARRYAEDYAAGRTEGELDEEKFGSYLYSGGIPDPDLLIRPGGEERISNFLLWQCAYSEFYFTDVLWPDFTPAELDRAIAEYRRRDRRFGGVKVK